MSTPSGSLGDRHARRVSIVAPFQIPSFDSRVIREITHLATDNILAVSDVVRYDNEALRPCVPSTSECIVKTWPCIYLGIFNLIGPISTAVNIIWPKIAATVNTNHLFKLRNLYRGVLCLGARDVWSILEAEEGNCVGDLNSRGAVNLTGTTKKLGTFSPKCLYLVDLIEFNI